MKPGTTSMKVVLFCGGFGTRLREDQGTIPKPLVQIGSRPILCQLMDYYAHHGHSEFVLCLGYGGDSIRQFFEQGSAPHQGRTIHCVETGLHSTIADRLAAVEPYVRGDSMFLANYSDGLTDLPLSQYVGAFQRTDATAGFVSVRISQSYHMVATNQAGTVTALTRAQEADVWINGGFFVLRPEIFDYLQPGDELVDAPFKRLMERGRLYSYRYAGFWAAVDTYKDRLSLERRYRLGDAPWEVWRGHA
jgi:glucose-1-phosphate cytidylyltransferase